jgi:histidinol-phosphate aminotransferase
MVQPIHGGPDGGSDILWDFSSNANPLPVPGFLRRAIRAADRGRYPDQFYTAIRQNLAQVAGVEPWRVLPTAGNSEAIRRLTLAARCRDVREVLVPWPGYGDYFAAAKALEMRVTTYGDLATLTAKLTEGRISEPRLIWICEPCNPTGQSHPAAFWRWLLDGLNVLPPLILAVDRAYEPLRLFGEDPVPASLASHCWQLWTPNKALGLTGVRAGWLQAPEADPLDLCSLLADLAPSWVLAAEGVSLLEQWYHPNTKDWLESARRRLRQWMARQQSELAALGWVHRPSVTPYFLTIPPLQKLQDLPNMVARLRQQGLKLRDTTSMGLPGHIRLRAHCPAARRALLQELELFQR